MFRGKDRGWYYHSYKINLFFLISEVFSFDQISQKSPLMLFILKLGTPDPGAGLERYDTDMITKTRASERP